MSDALDTGGPQGPPPTSPSEKSGSGGGGAGVDLVDRLASEMLEAQLASARMYVNKPDAPHNRWMCMFSIGQTEAILARVRVLEAVAEAARELARADVEIERDFTDASEKAYDAAQDALLAAVAALAAAGGGDRHE